ncbi:hypothetical protein D3C86_1157320 [compost metagenome]
MLCFLEEGVIRKFILDQKPELPKEICLDFFLAGDIFTAKADNEIESQYIYESISEGKLWFVSMDVVRDLFASSLLCSATQKVFMDEKLREKNIREIQLLKSSPQEVYTYLLAHKPRFIQHVPLKHLCSYIGVTPQALSRIRKRIN